MTAPRAFIAKSVTLGQGALIGGQGTDLMAALRFDGRWNDIDEMEELTVVTTNEGLRILGLAIASFLLELEQ